MTLVLILTKTSLLRLEPKRIALCDRLSTSLSAGIHMYQTFVALGCSLYLYPRRT